MSGETTSMTGTMLKLLRDKIQNCVYMPGNYIYERELCEETGYGRTPVREALLLLQREGSIEILPRRGIRVTPFTYQSVEEIYQNRKILEPTVCEKYYLRLEKERLLWFDQQFSQVSGYDDRSYFELDTMFHKWLVSSAENSQLTDFFNRVMDQQYRFSMYTSKVGTAVRGDCYTEHHRIIEALLTEEPESIKRALIDHINYSQAIALRTLQQTGAAFSEQGCDKGILKHQSELQ